MNHETLVFRPSIGPYVVWGIVLGSLTAGSLFVALEKPAAWPPFWIFSGGWAAIWLWIAGHQVRIDGTCLCVRYFFGLWKSCPLEFIRKVKVGFGLPEGSLGERAGPNVRLFVTFDRDGEIGHVWINLKLFSRRDVRAMKEILEQYARR